MTQNVKGKSVEEAGSCSGSSTAWSRVDPGADFEYRLVFGELERWPVSAPSPNRNQVGQSGRGTLMVASLDPKKAEQVTTE